MAKVEDIKMKKRDSWDRGDMGGGVKASLKIVYEIQYNFQFPMNQTFLSSPIQSAEVLIIYSESLTEWVEGLFYHDLTELCMKKAHLGLPKYI